jgi:hypothetical protein
MMQSATCNAIIPIFGEYDNGRTSAQNDRYQHLHGQVRRQIEGIAGEKEADGRGTRGEKRHSTQNALQLGIWHQFGSKRRLAKTGRIVRCEPPKPHTQKIILNIFPNLAFYLLIYFQIWHNIIPVAFKTREYKPRISPVREPAFGLNVTNFGTEAGFLF